MDLVLARQRVDDARVGRLGTVTPAGRPHLVPVCFVVVGDVAYTAVDAKPKTTLDLHRLRNIEATPSVCLLVDHYDENWQYLWWVRLDATARVVASTAVAADATTALAAKYPQYGHVPIPGPVIALDITRWTAWP